MKAKKRNYITGCSLATTHKCRHSLKPSLTFIATLILWTATGIQPITAQSTQDFLAANIDSAVSPQEDFYQYTNGGGFKRNTRGEGLLNVVNEEILSRQRKLSEKAASTKTPRGSDEQLIGDFWFTGMDAEMINKQGFSPLQPVLDRIDRIHSVADLIDVAASLNTKIQLFLGDNVLFLGYVWRDEKDSDRWVYYLSQGGISMTSPRYYSETNPNTDKVRNGFREYLFKTFGRLYKDRGKARTSADAVFNLEARLSKAFGEGDEYRRITPAELSDLAPTINWNRYFGTIGLERTDFLVMKRPGFFQALDTILRKVPLATWKDYLRFRLIKITAPYLDDTSLDDFFNYDRAYTGAQRPRDRWERVMRHMELRLGQPLARLFAKKYCIADMKPRYHQMAEAIRSAFRDRITQLDWMSDTTKRNALHKLARMKLTIGFPDKWTDFSTMPLKRDSYVLNVIRANMWLNEQQIKKLGSTVDRSEADLTWRMRGDAGYNFSNNEIQVPLNFVMRDSRFGDQEPDDAFVYGKTGATIGHEIAHGFDNNGRYFDSDGTKVNWWNTQDALAFNERVQALIDQYNEFMPVEGIHIDGQRTLSENMADLTGLLVALDAFKRTDQFKKGETIGGFTPLQRFFLAFAYTENQQTPQSLASSLQSGIHSPRRERVNGVLMNIPEFYEAFEVKPGDRMYRAENKRARIW